MESDSESQDSDDGRRFRFEATRKEPVTLSRTRRKDSPPRSRPSDRRSRSRDRNFRDDRSRHSRDERRSRSSSDRDSNSRHSTKERGPKGPKSATRDSKRRSRERAERESRHRAKEPRDHDSGKHKSKSREKHKKRSRSRERVKEPLPAEPEEEPRPRPATKKQRPEDAEKVTDKVAEKASAPAASNPVAVSDALSRAVAPAQEALRKKPKSFFDRVVNKRSVDEDASVYGPALPPALEKKLLNAREAEGAEPSRTPERVEAPAADDQVIGPVLPPGFGSSSTTGDAEARATMENSDSEEEEKLKEDEEEGSFGPALPPHLERREVVGPILPANFLSGDVNCKVESSKSDSDDDDYDDEVAGPLPPDHPAARGSYVQMQLEQRARQVEAKFRDKTSPEKKKREEWMTELPPAHAVALGLGSIRRKFKARDGPDMSDRSSWTDTPEDRLRKQKEKEENRFVAEESSKAAKKSKHKEIVEEPEEKQESLLDMHLKTLKKKKKKLEKEAKELGLSTRRPFDRDVDLQTNRLDDARKKKIFEKASRLNDRFTAGKY